MTSPFDTRRLTSLMLALSALACSGEPAPVGGGKNLVLITLDTTRADSLSCLGGRPGTTPRIDELAARSALFTFAASETNITNPSHISIMTGLRAIEHGVISNPMLLPEGIDTLAEAFLREGYRTAAFTAANHLASVGWRGFETSPRVKDVLDGAEVADRALAWLDDRGDDPFFLWVHFFDSHILYTPPRELAHAFYEGDPARGDGPRIADHEYFETDRNPGLIAWLRDSRDLAYPRAMYAATLNHVDTQVGRLLDVLAERELADRTVVVVTGDHGETLDEHGVFYNHRGLYEQDLRIPLLIHFPGAAGTRFDGFVTTLDIVPTLEQGMGLRLENSTSGMSLLPVVLGQGVGGLDAREVFVHQQAHNHSVAARQGDWKLWWPIVDDDPFLPPGPQLFNLRDDPGEMRNLLDDEPERAAALEELLAPWIALRGVVKGTLMQRTPEQQQMLRDLGYAGGNEDD